MPLVDLTALRASLAALERALHALSEATDATLRELLGTAAIKNFELTYGLACKAMQRWLDLTQDRAQLDALYVRRDLFRFAAQVGLIADPVAWIAHHTARNQGVHTYREEVAEAAIGAARLLPADVGALAAQIAAHND